MKYKVLLLSALSFLLLSACNSDNNNDIEQSKTIRLTVGSEKYKWPEGWIVDETFRGDCFNVKYDAEAWGEEWANIWTHLCSPIEGFDYVEGYEYDLLVKVTPIKDPPEDADNYRYVLIEIISQTNGK
jgi:hypothetical protein